MARTLSAAPLAPHLMETTDGNILLIVLDDIGVEWFRFYGIGDRFTTDPDFQYASAPVLEALVNDGVLFTEAYANPICGPTRATLQTGMYAFRTGFGDNLRDPWTQSAFGNRLSESFTWLPKAIHLARPGVYDTAVIGKWHLCDGYSYAVTSEILPAPDANLDHAILAGYDYSSIHLPNYGGTYSWYRIVNGVVDPPPGFVAPPFNTSNWAPSVHLADSLSWINSRTKPWFLYLAFNAPHSAFTVPPFETLSAERIDELETAGYSPGMSLPAEATYPDVKLIWRASIESVDHCIGQLLDGMSPETRAKTTILVMSDNGTVAQALPPGFAHFKREVYRGGTQVPMFASGARVVAPGRLSSALTHSVDAFATVLDLAGGVWSGGSLDSDGRSVVPVLENGAGTRARVFTESFRPWGQRDPGLQNSVQRALFDGRFRYVVRNNTAELYDNDAQFLETAADNVIQSHAALAAQFARELDEIVGS